jgi:hypothetical protein
VPVMVASERESKLKQLTLLVFQFRLVLDVPSFADNIFPNQIRRVSFMLLCSHACYSNDLTAPRASERARGIVNWNRAMGP